ncbi:MAG: methyl-accepting chemotaxis protein [Lachnospiraceae bacterium]|nr:methyl-accepting chemotaxis protein [Lachnospiraceae bacterium]
MKQKTRKMSIKMKILLPASILILVICVSLGALAYMSVKSGMTEMGIEEAEMVAKMAVNVVDSDLVSALVPGCESTEGYKQTLSALRNVQENFGIEYLYTLYEDKGKVYYGVDTDKSELQAKVGKPFEKSYDEMKKVFEGEAYVQEYIDHSEYGDVISAYMPIKNKEGKVIAVIGSDYDASNVLEKVDKIAIQIVLSTIICEIIAVLIMCLISSRITRGLRIVNQKIYDLVYSKGDLTQKLDITSGDEMELIAGNVNSLLEHIREIMLNIAGNSLKLTGSSKNIVDNIAGAELNITDISATMEEMSAGMEETSATINQVNESVVSVYDVIDNISKNANEGKSSSHIIMQKATDIYEKSVEEQKEARRLAEEMSSAVNEKIERSKAVEEISTLTDNIINITEETNLLSLNASIEAARAGEVGKGFAVVADEIGKLAMNSADTASQIQKVSAKVIASVNELAEEAEAMLEFMDKTAMRGYEKLFETSESYRSDVGDINRMMESFANESDDIKVNIGKIKEAMEAANVAVEESAKGVVNVTEMSVKLTERISDIGNEAHANMNVADDLNEEVNKFKLE